MIEPQDLSHEYVLQLRALIQASVIHSVMLRPAFNEEERIKVLALALNPEGALLEMINHIGSEVSKTVDYEGATPKAVADMILAHPEFAAMIETFEVVAKQARTQCVTE